MEQAVYWLTQAAEQGHPYAQILLEWQDSPFLPSAILAVNSLLHEFRQYIVGRMGIPYRERNVSIISVVLDAPGDATSSLSGKLGMIKGVSAKTLTAKL